MNYLFIDLNFDEFANELKLLEPNKRRLKTLKECYNDQIYLLSGLKSANPNKQPGTTNQSYINEKKLEQYAQLEPLQNEIERLTKSIIRTEKMLNFLEEDFRNMLNDAYVKGKALNSLELGLNTTETYKIVRYFKKRYNEIKKGYNL